MAQWADGDGVGYARNQYGVQAVGQARRADGEGISEGPREGALGPAVVSGGEQRATVGAATAARSFLARPAIEADVAGLYP